MLKLDLCYAPSVHNPSYGRLFWIIADVWTKAVDHTSKVMICTPDNIPVVHEWLEGLMHNSEAPMEQSLAEVSEDFFIDILSAA